MRAAAFDGMNRSFAILSALTLVAVAGCAVPEAAEGEELAMSSESALASIADAPAETPSGDKPKVETVDLSTVDFDLSALKDSYGNIDFGKVKIDVLDTGTSDHDFSRRPLDLDLKWVESDRRELPAFVDKIKGGVDVGGGKCRINSLSFKKIVVGCKWTW